jgi:hypothetical protein
MGNAFVRLVLAAFADLVFASVATSMPTYPARALQRLPNMYAPESRMLSRGLDVNQIGCGRKTSRIIDITITKYASVLYIRLRKALDPCLMAPETNLILSVPGS